MNLPEPAVLAGSQVLGLVALPSSAVTARLATDPAPGAEAAPNQWSFVGKQYLDLLDMVLSGFGQALAEPACLSAHGGRIAYSAS